MKNFRFSFLYFALFTILSLSSCKKESFIPELPAEHEHMARTIYTGFPETFESGSKTTYTTANVTLSTGSWNFSDAMIGTTNADRKNGLKAARIQNTGRLTMNFDLSNGASLVSLSYAKYNNESNSRFELWASSNSGSSWVRVGSAVSVTSSVLTQANFTVAYNGKIRFQIRKLSGGRINIDDFNITDNVTTDSTTLRDDNLAMGNPSNATTDTAFKNNYLMTKSQYALSYNNSKGAPNWVSWHLNKSWMGSAARCDCFATDLALPAGFTRVTSTDYTGSGFDRGHMCPSADRNASSTDNAATFLMTNMMPQSPNLNQITWENLESYCRSLVNAGNELYIISGGLGTGGTGSLGGVTNSLAGGKINVPAQFWKVILVLPAGTNDISRVSASSRAIAVMMPNNQTVNANNWGFYRTSIDAIETATGYDFLSRLPADIQSAIESVVDNGPIL